MPPSPQEEARSLRDFVDVFKALSTEGLECIVIGGCAVGAYAELRGERVFSADLDLYTTPQILEEILAWVPRHGGRVVKRPQPRLLPVAVIEWRGREVNVLTESDGLPDPALALRTSREFELRESGGFSVSIADPFDLLSNKQRLGRDKDRAHCALLRRFVDEEVVHAFRELSHPRERLAPARRLMEALSTRVLPRDVSERLLPLAKTPADFRFLVHHLPDEGQIRSLLERTVADPVLLEELRTIQRSRRF